MSDAEPQEGSKFHRIDVRHEQYWRFQQEIEKDASSPPLGFGEHVLKELGRANVFVPVMRKERWGVETEEEARKVILDNARNLLKARYEDPRSKSFVKTFYEHGRGVSEVKATLETKQGRTNNAEELFDPNIVDDELFVEFIDTSVWTFNQNKERFARSLPGYVKSFKDRLNKAMQSGLIPELPEDVISSRLDNTKIFLVDGLIAKTNDLYGSAYIGEERVEIMQQVYEISQQQVGNSLLRRFLGDTNETEELVDTFDAILTHEMLHLLSGRTILLEERTQESWGEMETQDIVTHQRDGLTFDTKKDKVTGKRGNRFSWLNEAMTEEIALMMTGGKDIGIYKDYRVLLNLLRTKGKHEIPFDLFTKAYFENYRRDGDDETGVPQWKELNTVINEVYEPAFLVKVDDIRTKQGLKAAATFITQFKQSA